MNINTFPYYDDFNKNKKYYEILFKPGYSVQARELTQLQTILQNQIKEFGDTIFKQGTVITGCAESHNFKTPYVKINDIDTSAYPLSYYEGMTVTASNGVSAIIKKTMAGSEAENPNLNTLYLHYTSNNTSDTDPALINTVSTFSPNDILTVTGNNSGVGTFQVASVSPTGEGSLFSLNDGIVYVNGRFLVHSNQTIVIDRYSSTPTKKVGFRVVEDVITAIDDATLNDPAQGSYNFNAPGADRYEVTTVLASYGVGEDKPTDFFLLFEIEGGVIKRRYDKTQYSDLSTEFANRTYDESGDYTVRAFPIIVNEHLSNGTNHGKYTAGEGGSSGKLVVGIEPGKAYVRGYEQELFSTEFISIDKSYKTNTVQNQGISTFYGNYILVRNVTGSWYLNNGASVSIRNAVCSGSYPSLTVGGNEIGTAKVRGIQWESGTIGTSGAIYRLYLHDIKFVSGGVANINSFHMNDGHDSFADVQGTPAFLESKFTAPIFPLTHKNVKSLADSTFAYTKTFTTYAVDGTGHFTVNLSAGEEWAFSTISDEIIKDNIRVVLAQEGGLGIRGMTFNIAQADVTYVSSTQLTFNLNAIPVGSPTVDVMISVRKTTSTAGSKTLRTHRYVKLDVGNEGPYCLGLHDVVEIENIWMAPTANAFPTSDPLTTDPVWNDVTSSFTLDNGQRDTFYDLASLVKNTTDTISGNKLLVKLTHFEHASNGGYYTVQSYPLPSEGVAPTAYQIEWFQIPSYTTSNGATFNLRDCIDFRLTANNTATPDPTTIALATINPSSTITFASGATSPIPTDTFLTDITTHLSRIDRVVLDSTGAFSVIAGVPANNPIAPRQPNTAMSLAIINIPAFPSLSPYYARQIGKQEYAISITFVDNSRFTMRDIGSVQRRVERLEQYSSLSILEQQATSLFIPDNYGNNRYKNGIMVDPLIGHNVGNVFDPDYACSIAKGEARPFFNLDNVFMEYDADLTSGVVRNASDKSIVVQQVLIGSTPFTAGETITSDGGGSAVLRYFSPLTTNDQYSWIRMYLESATGIITTGSIITGTSSGAVGTVPSVVPAIDFKFPAMVNTPQPGILATLPYTHKVYTESPYATKSRNCSSQILFSFEGSMELSPSSDEWPDTSVQPEILYNTDGVSDNWVTMTTAWGTQWENWKTLWQKYDSGADKPFNTAIDPSVLTTSQRQLRDGIALNFEESVTTNVIPYMRSTVITFTATRLKANTSVFPFFDGVDVSAHCKMSTATAYGDGLATDEFGSITGQFRIPPETFMSGSKNFVLSDVSSDPFSESATTMAYASYTSSGDLTFDENTVLSTQKPETTFDYQRTTQNTVIERQITTSNPLSQTIDPIAQTFFVSNSNGGILLTKIGVYFQTKSSTTPITLQLRETQNGLPTEIIVPYSTVTLLPEDINTSLDGTGVTEFVFPSPVYLKNNTEYAFVLLPMGNNTDYNVWVGELGQMDVGTTVIVDKQPNAGTLYVSGNNRTWTEFINEDIKFTAFSGNFSGTGNLVLHNEPIEYMTFTNMTGIFYPGDALVGTGAGSGEGTIQHFNYQTNEAQVLVTSGYFDASDSIVCNVTGYTASTTRNVKAVDAISPTLSYLDFNNTDISWSYKMYQYDGTPYDFGNDLGYSDLPVSGTTEFFTPMAIFSNSQYDHPSLMMKAVLTTDSSNISPVVDLEKVGCVIIGNALNNPASVLTSEAGNGGTAASRYISRTVILDDGQEADDLRVYLSSFTPSGSSIAVYARLLNPEDNTPFAERPWTPMTANVISGTGDYREKYFTLPTTGSATESGGLASGIYKYTKSTTLYAGFKSFAIKIVFLSDNTTRVPKIRDLRTIALQA